jgi:hypothetical protein
MLLAPNIASAEAISKPPHLLRQEAAHPDTRDFERVSRTLPGGEFDTDSCRQRRCGGSQRGAKRGRAEAEASALAGRL